MVWGTGFFLASCETGDSPDDRTPKCPWLVRSISACSVMNLLINGASGWRRLGSRWNLDRFHGQARLSPCAQFIFAIRTGIWWKSQTYGAQRASPVTATSTPRSHDLLINPVPFLTVST